MARHAKTQELIDNAREVLEDYSPLTLRGVFYQLVSNGVIENTMKEYQRLSPILTKARENGEIPWSCIIDNTRRVLGDPSPRNSFDSHPVGATQYLYPTHSSGSVWGKMPHHVELFVEKDAMADWIYRVVSRYDVGLNVIKGYCSSTFKKQITDRWSKVKKPIHVYYCGDFDASGLDLERDVREKVQDYFRGEDMRLLYVYDNPYSDSEIIEQNVYAKALASTDKTANSVIHWHRIAVLHEDMASHNLVEVMAKPKDTRSTKFMERFGTRGAELDALAGPVLSERLHAAIRQHIDFDLASRMDDIDEEVNDRFKTYGEPFERYERSFGKTGFIYPESQLIYDALREQGFTDYQKLNMERATATEYLYDETEGSDEPMLQPHVVAKLLEGNEAIKDALFRAYLKRICEGDSQRIHNYLCEESKRESVVREYTEMWGDYEEFLRQSYENRHGSNGDGEDD